MLPFNFTARIHFYVHSEFAGMLLMYSSLVYQTVFLFKVQR